jgi:hypothetical protein
MVRRLFTIASSLCLGLCLQACAVYEALGGMPYAEAEIHFASRPTLERALDCVKTSIVALGPEKEVTLAPGVSFLAKHGRWSTTVTKQDYKSGVLETGNYPMSNIVGVQVRAKYLKESAGLRIQLKAAGFYYADLGAPEHLAELRESVTRCVDA